MKIFVKQNWNEKVFTLECESTDTIAHLKAKVHAIEVTIPLHLQSLKFDGKQLGDNFSENMTLTDVGVQEGSMLLLSEFEFSTAGVRERPPQRSEKDYLYYANAFKSGWREEHAKVLLHLLLELCKDGTISEGIVTDEAWLRIQNGIQNSTNCSFQIDCLKERLCDYQKLYSLLVHTSSQIFHWYREKKTVRINSNRSKDWRKVHPELLLLCGAYIPYFDTLEEVCLLLNTNQCSEQQISETSTAGVDLPSTMKIFVKKCRHNFFPLECESTDTIAHLIAKVHAIGGTTPDDQMLMFDGKELGDNFSENMTLTEVGVHKLSMLGLSELCYGEFSTAGVDLPSTMKMFVNNSTGKVFSLECESTETIAHLKEKVHVEDIPTDEQRLYEQRLWYDGKYLSDENMTLADIGIKEGSMFKLSVCHFSGITRESAGVDLPSTMEIYVSWVGRTEKVFTLECELTDTIAHLKAKVHAIEGTTTDDQMFMFDGKELGDNFSENMTLTDVGVQEGSMLLLQLDIGVVVSHSAGVLERPPQRPEKDYLYYANAFKSGWREEHAKVLLHLFLELCKDGTISEGNVTDEAWLRIQNGLQNSTNCSFQIDFLQERLCDYQKLYSLLVHTSSRIFHWDREKKTVTIYSRWSEDWRKVHPELLLLCGAYIPYFDTLEEVCLLLNTKQSSEQQASETSTSINNEKLPTLSKFRRFPQYFSSKKNSRQI